VIDGRPGRRGAGAGAGALLALLALLVSLTASLGCASVQAEVVRGPAPERRPLRLIDPALVKVEPVVFDEEQAFAFFDGDTGRSLGFDEVLARARQARVVVVGEQHDDPAHHELQRRLVTALASGAPGLAVGLEMLTWKLQSSLDQYNRGDIDADGLAAGLDWPRAWGFTFELYRPIFVDGHAAGARFVALNAPRELVKAVRRKGVAGLSEQELRELPDLDLADEEHRRWFHRIFSEGGHPAKPEDVESFYVAQVVWDETMAERTVQALDDGARQVVVLAGIGHVARGRGIPQRVERRRDGLRVLSVVPLTGVDSENAQERVRRAIIEGEGDIIVVPRFEEAIEL
jgi:uncharacterized iron-regulated protein